MPKNPPAPIHIRIDSQEQRSGIPDLLAARAPPWSRRWLDQQND